MYHVEMGLDAACNNVSVKCGSYGAMTELHTSLLIALKDYLEMESEVQGKNVMIDILIQTLKDKQYRKLNYPEFQMEFWRFDLEGFFPLIAIEDQGSMTSHEAKRFMKTFRTVRESLCSRTLRRISDLQSVLQESIRTGDDVHFF